MPGRLSPARTAVAVAVAVALAGFAVSRQTAASMISSSWTRARPSRWRSTAGSNSTPFDARLERLGYLRIVRLFVSSAFIPISSRAKPGYGNSSERSSLRTMVAKPVRVKDSFSDFRSSKR